MQAVVVYPDTLGRHRPRGAGSYLKAFAHYDGKLPHPSLVIPVQLHPAVLARGHAHILLECLICAAATGPSHFASGGIDSEVGFTEQVCHRFDPQHGQIRQRGLTVSIREHPRKLLR